MPLMREWAEVAVEQDLLIPVVRELLALAVDPNHVEIVDGANGRVILVETRLAEYWYQHRLNQDTAADIAHVVDEVVDSATKESEVVAVAETPATVADVPAKAKVEASTNSSDVPSATAGARTSGVTRDQAVLPTAKQGPGRPRTAARPSASLDGEEL